VNTTHLLFGSGGILGSGYETALAYRGAEVVRLTPRWEVAGDCAAVLEAALLALTSRRTEVNVIWAAGIGHTGAGAEAMRAESAAVRSVCDVISRLSAARPAGVALLFASSAGAIYGGHGYSEISETDPPHPVTAYGREKLVQEDVLHAFAAECGTRVAICRYTNLYGLARGRLTKRGLVSTAVRATRLRQPMVVYVNPDTRRDLVYSVDAAAESLRVLEGADVGVTTALIANGETRTVSEILAVVGRISGRRVPATYGERPETRLQPKVLRFRRERPSSIRRTPMEVAIHHMLRAPMTP
jgi:nucleoside-diphosphate-sugar epimerase